MKEHMQLFQEAVAMFEHSIRTTDILELLKDFYAISLLSLKSINYLYNNITDAPSLSLGSWYTSIPSIVSLPRPVDKRLLDNLESWYNNTNKMPSLWLSYRDIQNFCTLAKDCLYNANSILTANGFETGVTLHI